MDTQTHKSRLCHSGKTWLACYSSIPKRGLWIIRLLEPVQPYYKDQNFNLLLWLMTGHKMHMSCNVEYSGYVI